MMVQPRNVWFVVSADWPAQEVKQGRAIRLDLDTNCWVIWVDGDGLWDVEDSRVVYSALQARMLCAWMEYEAQQVYDNVPPAKLLEYPVPSLPEPNRYRTWQKPDTAYSADFGEAITVSMKEWL